MGFMKLLVNCWKVAQELVGIFGPYDRENGLDGNWALMDISFHFFQTPIPMYQRPATLAVVSGEGMGEGLGVGLDIINESSALARFLPT